MRAWAASLPRREVSSTKSLSCTPQHLASCGCNSTKDSPQLLSSRVTFPMRGHSMPLILGPAGRQAKGIIAAEAFHRIDMIHCDEAYMASLVAKRQSVCSRSVPGCSDVGQDHGNGVYRRRASLTPETSINRPVVKRLSSSKTSASTRLGYESAKDSMRRLDGLRAAVRNWWRRRTVLLASSCLGNDLCLICVSRNNSPDCMASQHDSGGIRQEVVKLQRQAYTRG
jgi:hypothetical protein